MRVFVSSQIRRYQKFMADKNAHSWCGRGSKSPIPIAGPNGRSEIIDKPRGKEIATNETSDSSHVKHREARSPP